ncbi:hypothetical protein ScPMuIL_004674 [Solemya velum]
MKHGFMKSIIKNQVDRDNYDKEVRAAKKTDKNSKNAHRSKKPDVNVYIPPTSRQKSDINDELFHLEFEDKDEELHYITIYKDDKPAAVSRKLGQHVGLSAPFILALESRIREEMNIRLCPGASSS